MECKQSHSIFHKFLQNSRHISNKTQVLLNIFWAFLKKPAQYTPGYKVGVIRTEIHTEDPGSMSREGSDRVSMLPVIKNI